jgi:hypothetical protein
MTIALGTLTLATALAAAGPALAGWNEPYCERVEMSGNLVCMTEQSGSGGRSGAEQVLTIALTKKPDAIAPVTTSGITDKAWSMPTCRGLRPLAGVDAQKLVETEAGTNSDMVLLDIEFTDLPALQRGRVLHVSLAAFAESYPPARRPVLCRHRAPPGPQQHPPLLCKKTVPSSLAGSNVKLIASPKLRYRAI